MAGLPPEERCEQRLARSKPVMDALLTWAETKSAAVPKSALGKALYYLREQWPYLIRFLGDGQLEIFNNRAERSVKPFVMSCQGESSLPIPVSDLASERCSETRGRGKEFGREIIAGERPAKQLGYPCENMTVR